MKGGREEGRDAILRKERSKGTREGGRGEGMKGETEERRKKGI
jgi:hypothetical protein